MPTTRSSKRSHGEPADDGLPKKRTRRPASTTLAAFVARQPPPKVSNRGIGRRIKSPALTPTPLINAPRKKAKALPIQISSTPAPSSPKTTTSTTNTPAKKSKATAPPPLFDPTTIANKDPHWITISITPDIEGKRKEKDQILITHNINNSGRANLHELQQHFYTEYVAEWEEHRGLVGGNRPRKLHWKVTIGNSKGVHRTIRVKDEKGWDSVEANLRQMRHSGDTKNCDSILVDALYKTFDRLTTPDVDIKASKTTKSKASTVRATPLNIRPPLDNYSDPFPDDVNEPDFVLDEPALPTLKPVVRPRDSATSRQLAQKAVRDSGVTAVEKIRQSIYAYYTCKDLRCSNKSGCCYHFKSRKTHHKISHLEQEEWAQDVVYNFEDVTIDRPRRAWLINYQDGYAQTTMKRSGKKTASTPTTPDIEVLAPVQQPVQQPQQPPYYAPQPPYGYPYAPPPQYPPQYPPIHQESQHQRRAAAPPPSSPPRASSPIQATDNDELMNAFGRYLLLHENRLARRQAIEKAIELIQEQFIEYDSLRSVKTLQRLEAHGVPIGIIDLIKTKRSQFSTVYRAQREMAAVQGLIGMGNARPPTTATNQQPAFQPISQYSRQSGV